MQQKFCATVMKNNDVDKQQHQQQHANAFACEYEQAKSKFSYFQQIFIFNRFHAFVMHKAAS